MLVASAGDPDAADRTDRFGNCARSSCRTLLSRDITVPIGMLSIS